MARVRPRVPGKRARRAGAPQLPVQAERDFARALVTMADAMGRRVRPRLLALAEQVGRPPPEKGDERADAQGKSAKAAAAEARGAAEGAAKQAFNASRLRAETDRAARRVDAHSKDQFRRLGVSPKREPVLNVLVSGWARDISSKMSGLGTSQARKFEAILLSGESRYASTLAKEIEEQIGVTKTYAEFIARNGVNQLNGKITRERFRAAEIDLYIWTTQNDDRVREAHADLEGEVFDVDGDGDPDEGHPGDMPNCRCIQFPLKSDKDEDEPPSDEEPEDEDPEDDEDEDE